VRKTGKGSPGRKKIGETVVHPHLLLGYIAKSGRGRVSKEGERTKGKATMKELYRVESCTSTKSTKNRSLTDETPFNHMFHR